MECGAFETRGYAALEHRQFYESPLYDDAEDSQPSLVLESQFYWGLGAADSLTLTPFARLDAVDDERTHWDLREAKWVHQAGNWDFEAGNAMVFWGVAESQHLVDVINQRDSVEDITGDARLGQPMLHGRYLAGRATLEGFILPLFRERTFAAAPGRLRLPLPVDTDDPEFESSEGRHHTDYALRGSFTAGGWDVGLSFFDGTDREPVLLLAEDSTELLPFYGQMTQYGADIQVTTEKTLWKLEARYRDSTADDYFAYVAGLEHAYYQVFGTGLDVSLLLEYNWDERGDQASTPYQDDVFLGFRMVLNDEAGTEALIGVVADLEHASRFGRVRASTRLWDSVRLGFEAYWFRSDWMEDPIYPIRNEDHVILSLKYFY
jgi:hypothetical protein